MDMIILTDFILSSCACVIINHYMQHSSFWFQGSCLNMSATSGIANPTALSRLTEQDRSLSALHTLTHTLLWKVGKSLRVTT